MPLTAIRASFALRATIGLLITIHGIYRILAGGVAPFGEFLDGSGVPLGTMVAWLITVVESVGGPALMLGFLVTPLCAWFAVELTFGIILVHAGSGWFVVGGGRNGMEFSVLLIMCFVVTAMLDRARREADFGA